VDDGLPLRKAALTCVETVLEMLPEYVQAETFLPRLVALLSDKVREGEKSCVILYCIVLYGVCCVLFCFIVLYCVVLRCV
jgi:TATA-binding protein interacting (TIP20)